MSVLEEALSILDKNEIEIKPIIYYQDYRIYKNMTIGQRKIFYKTIISIGFTKIVVFNWPEKNHIDYYVMNENGELELL